MSERIIKPWGWSHEVYRDELTRVVRIHVEPGGFCSVHKHERQDNTFHVLSGDLWIHYEGGSKEIGDSHNARIMTVEHSARHQFENKTKLPVEALEVYESTDGTPPDASDIVRFSEGGIIESPARRSQP